MTMTACNYSYTQARDEVMRDIKKGAIVAGCPFSQYPAGGWVLAFAPENRGDPVRLEIRSYANLRDWSDLIKPPKTMTPRP